MSQWWNDTLTHICGLMQIHKTDLFVLRIFRNDILANKTDHYKSRNITVLYWRYTKIYRRMYIHHNRIHVKRQMSRTKLHCETNVLLTILRQIISMRSIFEIIQVQDRFHTCTSIFKRIKSIDQLSAKITRKEIICTDHILHGLRCTCNPMIQWCTIHRRLGHRDSHAGSWSCTNNNSIILDI